MRHWSSHQHFNLNKQPHKIWALVTSCYPHIHIGYNIMNYKMSYITFGSVTPTPGTIHLFHQSTIIQLAIPSANTIKVHYILEPQQNNSPTPSWVIIIILIITMIILLRIICHNNKIMFLEKKHIPSHLMKPLLMTWQKLVPNQ